MLIDFAQQAQLHRETYSLLLRGLIPQGQVGAFARKVGIDQRTLSRIRNPYDVSEGMTGRMGSPSPELALTISKHLPLPEEEQGDIYEQMILAWQNEQNLRLNIRKLTLGDKHRADDWLRGQAMGEVLRVYRLAVFALSSTEARTFYAAALSLCRGLVREYWDAGLYLELAKVHTLLSDILSVLNRPVQAFYHARKARQTLEVYEGEIKKTYRDTSLAVSSDFAELWSDQGWEEELNTDYIDLKINTYRAEAVALGHLNLHKEATWVLNRQLKGGQLASRKGKWMSLLAEKWVSELSQIPSVAVDTLELEAQAALEIYERQNNVRGRLLLLATLARGYLLRGKRDKVRKILDSDLDSVEAVEDMYQLHGTMLLRRVAYLYYGLGQQDMWRHYLSQALSSAHQSKLTSIQRQLDHDYLGHPIYAQIHESIVGRPPRLAP